MLVLFSLDPTLQHHLNGQVGDGSYKYMGHLLALDACRPNPNEPSKEIGITRDIETPLRWEVWQRELSAHPGSTFAIYILEGIRQGFRTGFNRKSICRPASSNMPTEHPQIVSEYIERELALGRMVQVPSRAEIQISPIGLIPKKNRPDKWRLIVDLSSPKGFSVNEGIAEEWSSLSYATIDHLVAIIMKIGHNDSFMVKADIKEAYRMVPIHPHDRWLLGVRWDGKVYTDTVLPFGLRSAPKIFSAVADAAQWILVHKGVEHILHYLDDYIMVSNSRESAEVMKQTLVSTFSSLGIPLEPSKLEGPEPCLTFLGIEVDAQLRLPEDKLIRLQGSLASVLGAKSVMKRDLQSVVGLLQHASKVVKPGRSFLRRLYALLAGVGSGLAQNHFIRLNAAARADIMWWHTFVSRWNGVSMFWASENSTSILDI